MARYPTADMNAHGADFSVMSPDAGKLLIPKGVNAIAGQKPDQRFFEIPHIGVNIPLPGTKAQYWISNQLARAMVSYVAAAIYIPELDASVLQRFFIDQKMGEVPAAAHCNGGRVFKKEEDVRSKSLLFSFAYPHLQFQRGRIRKSIAPKDKTVFFRHARQIWIAAPLYKACAASIIPSETVGWG
jgi:hypothetical protein